MRFPDGQVGAGYTIAKTRKSQAAHGVSILEARRTASKWRVVKTSPYGRRITSNTPMTISGPAAGHALMKTKEFLITDAASTPTGNTTAGTTCFGTVNNCAHGITPWGTYLACEENWNGNFGGTGAVDTRTTTEIGKLNRRYGVSAGGFGYRWHTTDARWDVATNPNEPHLFGWVVEIDPYTPGSTPIKCTALGRFKHESAQYVVDANLNLAFYMGDDERSEYIYKFVCAGKYNPTNKAANRNLLDSGTLYTAKFSAGLTGQWMALLPGTIGAGGVALRDNPNFSSANDAEVLAKILIKTRMAADAVGATMMDRPEWTGARPRINGHDEIEVYCTLTNNNRRGTTTASSNAADGSTASGSARPPVDAANPREDNVHGHIIRWRETGKSVLATSFTWDLFVQAGDTATAKVAKPTNNYQGNIVDVPNGSADFGAPDGLWFDDFGRLWVQTDQVGDGSGDFVNLGANCMVCADPNTGEARRFFTGPNQCEVTGVTMTPDGKAMFVGIQHPGDDSVATNPTAFSKWPQGQFAVESDGLTAELGANNRDLGENGLWGGFGNHFVAAGDSGELTFTFANLASGVGAFLNHCAATPGSGSVTLSAFGSTGQLLETYSFSIGTSVDGYDQGQFYGINRSQFDIRSFTFSGVGAVADTLTVAMVPEPEGYALMLAGLGLMGWMTRRRQRG